MTMVLKRKKLTINGGLGIIQEVEKNPTTSQNETAKCFVLPPLSLSNIILQKTSILEERHWCGAQHQKQKKLILLNTQGSVS
jgi:hypothetical protein